MYFLLIASQNFINPGNYCTYVKNIFKVQNLHLVNELILVCWGPARMWVVLHWYLVILILLNLRNVNNIVAKIVLNDFNFNIVKLNAILLLVIPSFCGKLKFDRRWLYSLIDSDQWHIESWKFRQPHFGFSVSLQYFPINLTISLILIYYYFFNPNSKIKAIGYI